MENDLSLSQPVIDTHCHIDMTLEKGVNSDEIEAGLSEYNIAALVQIGSDPAAMEFSRDYCRNRGGAEKFYTVGWHPGEAAEGDYRIGHQFARSQVHDPRFVAIGEVGLDYYYTRKTALCQQEVFDSYLALADDLKKPVAIHTRDAHEDTISLLKKYPGLDILVHCFTGTRNQMEDYLELGASISFSGIVTFANADSLREAARHCPSGRIMVETDAPFLAPVPVRGKTNRPAWVRHVAAFLGNLREENLFPSLYENSVRFFNLPLESKSAR